MDIGAFRDEMLNIMKTAAAAGILKSRLLRWGVPAAGGAVVYNQGQKGVKDWETGRQYRKQMEGRRG